MTFTRKSKKASAAAKPSPMARMASGTARLPAGLLFRTLLLGMAAIAGAAWGLVRHCTNELPPLRVPSPSLEVDSGEIPAPELAPAD